MPPTTTKSRFALCKGYTRDDGVIFLSERVPFRYTKLADTITHTVREGDTLHNIASRYYGGVTAPTAPQSRLTTNGPGVSPSELWWVIADFQVPPIIDPTIQLEPGTLLYVPSLRTVQEQVLNQKRRILF